MRTAKNIIRSSSGQALTELALVLPMLLILALGAIEVSNMISSYLTLSHLTREGANMISRGIATPGSALDAIIDSSCPLISDGPPCPPSNEERWTIIYSSVVQAPGSPCPPTPCTYIIGNDRITSGDLGETSKIGDSVGGPATLPDIDSLGPSRTLFVVEAFYQYQTVTPVGNFGVNLASPIIFYERAVF
jgi:hypothetical protein